MKKSPREYKPYPSDVSDEEWSFVVPYLTLCRLDAEQREHDLRAVFNALRWLVRTGAHWRMMPHDFPPWAAVYQQTRRWLRAGCFESMVHDLRALLRAYAGRNVQPSAVVLDSRTLQSTPESGARAGYDGAKRRKGSKVHAAVDTLGELLALHVTPADEQDRDQVERLAEAVQDLTGHTVELAYVDQGYTGERAAQAAQLSTPRSNAASSCCRVDGWLNAALGGQHVSGVWQETMNASRRLSPDTTTSLLSASCFIGSFRSSQLHNRL
jgi:transposase